MASVVVAWLIFCCAIVVVLALAAAFVRFLHHSKEDEYLFVTVVSTAAVFLILLVLIVIPVDIYSVSSTRNADGEPKLSTSAISKRMDGVRTFYYILYGFVLFFTFIALPFVYFFQEERDPDTSDASRMAGACKFTLILLVILVILFVVGAIVTGSSPPNDPQTKQTFTNLANSESRGEATVGFAVMVLLILGYLALVSYTGSGLATMPIAMVRPSAQLSNLDREDEKVNEALLSTRERQWDIDAKLAAGRRVTKRDAEARKTLARSRRALERRAERVTVQKQSCWRRLLLVLRPFEVVFGLVFAMLSLFLVICLMLSAIDRAKNATCGYDCAFTMLRPQIANPYDMLMVRLSRLFPLDYVFMFLTTLYVFAVTTGALFRMDIRMCCWRLARVKRRRTSSQGLVMAVYIMLLALIGFSGLFVTLAPTYASYGSQVYRHASTGALKPCSLEAPVSAGCTMTELATFFVRISIKFPAVGTFFFAMNFVLILVYLVAFLISFLVRDARELDDSSDSDDFV